MKRSTVCECKIGRRANFAAVAGLIAQQNMFESSIFEEHCTGSNKFSSTSQQQMWFIAAHNVIVASLI